MRREHGMWRRMAGWTVQAVACAVLLPVAGWARVGQPVLRLPLEPFDYQPLPANVLSAGIAAMTLHYVDGTHLLVTFSRRRLLPRLPDAEPGDFDRNVDAVLVELPSGKMLAKTSWRLRDAHQYLWSLGEGEFLLRQRNRLTVFAPLRGLKKGDAFAQEPFLATTRTLGAVLLSPGRDLLTVETMDHAPDAEGSPSPGTRAYAAATAAAAGDAAAESNGVQIDFFRLVQAGADSLHKPARVGAIGAKEMVMLPVDGSGLLTTLDQGKGHWAFDFHHHDGGKVDELSPFDSSCRPVPMLVSRSEFIAFGCRGGQERRSMGGFNLRGEEMWEQMFQDSYTRPELVVAPAAGRFALGRMVTGTPTDANAAVGLNQVTAEQVGVYQTESGRLLLSLDLTPVMLAGGNFALSPDGSSLAVLSSDAIEVYALPEASGKERKSVEMAASLVPAEGSGPVRLDAIRARGSEVASAAAEPAVSVKPVGRARAADAVADAGAAAAESGAAEAPVASGRAPTPVVLVNGDPQMDAEKPRKAPTLYGPEDRQASGGEASAGK